MHIISNVQFFVLYPNYIYLYTRQNAFNYRFILSFCITKCCSQKHVTLFGNLAELFYWKQVKKTDSEIHVEFSNFGEISPNFSVTLPLSFTEISMRFCWNLNEIFVKFHWDFVEISLKFSIILPLSFTEILVKFHWDFYSLCLQTDEYRESGKVSHARKSNGLS